MDFSFLLAILLTFVSAEYGESSPVAAPIGRIALLAATTVALGVANRRIGCRVLAQAETHPFDVLRLERRLRTAHMLRRVVWLVFVAVCLFVVQWPRIIRNSAGLDGVILLRDLSILLPILATWWLTLTFHFRTRHAVQARRAGHAEPRDAWRRAARSSLSVTRIMTGVMVAPALCVLAARDAIAATGVSDSDAVTTWVAVAALPLMAALFPLVLRYVWRTRPLPETPLRRRLQGVANQVGVRLRDVIVWETGHMVRNAAIAGLGGRFRYVFLTDGLLAVLSDPEIETVVRHELGHARHHHLWWRLVCACVPASLFLAVGQVFPAAAETWNRRLEAAGSGGAVVAATAAVLVVLGYLGTVFARHARCLELQADLFVLASKRGGGGAPETERLDRYLLALEKLEGRAPADSDEGPQHPSLRRRMDFLRAAADSPEIAARFVRRLRCLHAALIGLLVSPLLPLVAGLVRAWLAR